MLWHERTNHKPRFVQAIKRVLITCVICSELEKRPQKMNYNRLSRIFYLHSYYSEDLIDASMSASSDIIITFKAFKRAFIVPRKIIPRYKKQSYIMKEIQGRPYCVKKTEIGSIYHLLLLFAE